jgi:hypothetical protein
VCRAYHRHQGEIEYKIEVNYMATKTTKQNKADKAEKKPAAKYNITQMVVTSAYAKTFSTGSRGFHGKAIDPATGKRFQIIGAVELAG